MMTLVTFYDDNLNERTVTIHGRMDLAARRKLVESLNAKLAYFKEILNT